MPAGPLIAAGSLTPAERHGSIERMFVLGIDPGLSRCGYGVVTRRSGSLAAVAGGVISTDPSTPLPERLRILADELRALVAEFRPEAVVVERVFFQVNARTAMATGQAAGVALVAAAESGCEVAQYTLERGQAGAGRLRRGNQGPGAADGVLGPRAGRSPPTAGRGRRVGAGCLPPDHAAVAAGGGRGGRRTS